MEWTDKENRIAVMLFISAEERAHTFELLKPLNTMRVFVNRTVKLHLETGGVSDCKRSDWPCVVCKPQVNNAFRSRINQNPVRKQRNHSSGK